jgi:hypothetical protein
MRKTSLEKQEEKVEAIYNNYKHLAKCFSTTNLETLKYVKERKIVQQV